jgi:hypothetical protein
MATVALYGSERMRVVKKLLGIGLEGSQGENNQILSRSGQTNDTAGSKKIIVEHHNVRALKERCNVH